MTHKTNKKLGLGILGILTLGLSACTATFDDSKDEKGYLKMSDVTVDVTSAGLSESRAVNDPSDFIVEITQGDEVKYTFNKVSLMPEVLEMEVGDYAVSARNIDLPDAAFDSPYYYADEEFAIKNNEVTEVGPLVCRLSNVKVTVQFTESLKAAITGNASVTVGYENGEKLRFTMTLINGGESGYFRELNDAGEFTAEFSGTVDGERTTFTAYYNGVKAGQHRIITFDLKENEDLEETDVNMNSARNGLNEDVIITKEHI